MPGHPGLPSAFPPPGPPGSVPASRSLPPWPYSVTTPTAFATRNNGWSSEVLLTVSEDGRMVDMVVAPEFSKPAGWEVMMMNAEELQPLMETRRLNANLQTPPGQPALAGTLNRPANTGADGTGKEDAVRLVFYTAIPTRPIPVVDRDAPADPNAPTDPFAPPEGAPSEEAGKQRPVPETLLRLEAFSLPPAAARKALLTHSKETELYSWLDAELARKDSGVILENLSTLRVRSGQRDKNEAVMEFPQGNEYDPPQIPQTMSLPLNGAPTPIPGTDSVYPPWPFTSTTASGIGTKMLGWTIEAEVTVGEDGKGADVNLTPELTRVVGKLLFGVNQDIVQPVYEVQRFNGLVYADLGQPALVCTFTPATGTEIAGANTSDRVWFLFSTVNLAE